jgi:hypothetical protein
LFAEPLEQKAGDGEQGHLGGKPGLVLVDARPSNADVQIRGDPERVVAEVLDGVVGVQPHDVFAGLAGSRE